MVVRTRERPGRAPGTETRGCRRSTGSETPGLHPGLAGKCRWVNRREALGHTLTRISAERTARPTEFPTASSQAWVDFQQ